MDKDQFKKQADAQFDQMARTYGDHSREILKAKGVFDAGFGDLTSKQFTRDDRRYIRKSLNNALQRMGEVIKILNQAAANHEDEHVTKQKMDEVKLHAKEEQDHIDAEYTQAHGGAKETGDNPGKGGPGDPDHDGPRADLKHLQDKAIEEGFRSPSGGGGVPGGGSGGGPGGGGSSSGGGGIPDGGSGASSNGSGSGSLADHIGDVVNSGAAQALAAASGHELDDAQYSRAHQDAQNALTLDPANQQAIAVSHFSEGRIDGIAGQGPGDAQNVEGKNKPMFVGSGAGGTSGSESGGPADSGNAGNGGYASGGGLSGSAGGISASLAAGGTAGGALSRMSAEQARKGAADALSMGDLGGALAYVNRALEQNPRDPALLNLRSTIRARQRDYAGAEADAKAGLELAPRDSALLRDLGFAQLREKDYNAAIATANKMLELNPNDPYAYAIRGHAYGSLGDRDAMLADLKRAAELDPSFRAAADSLAGQTELPSDKDMLFLFPGETAAAVAKPAAPAPGRGRSFGLLVGASALGGLLLALGLLATVLAPLKERVTSAFTRLTRTGPTVDAAPADETAPASVNGHLPGLVRGQYEISREIGAGGMGRVFAGVDRALGRPVAIKKMRDELRHDARERARFVAEAKTVAALHHPNIVDIYAIAEDGGDVFLVFEYVEGRTVHELLTGGRLAPAEAARIARASAEALEYAHGRGVVHRDMKPSNVMLDRSGAVKVMDFGIARLAKDTMLRQSATGTVAGTPPYMAPEQEQGHARAESDVYSLAVCAYEMLTGKLPFVGSGGGMLLNKINMSYVAPSRQAAGLPEALDGVFERAFQADPDKRFRTPREFAAALETAALAAARA